MVKGWSRRGGRGPLGRARLGAVRESGGGVSGRPRPASKCCVVLEGGRASRYSIASQELQHSSSPLRHLLQEKWRGKVEPVGWEPRSWLFRNFLSEEECTYLRTAANSSLVPSTVVDAATGGSVPSRVRTSSGMWFAKGQDAVISRIEERIALVTMIPPENGEGIQVLKYINGQQYMGHTDYFHDKYNVGPSHGGQRLATMLMYLSTPEEGGETIFTNVPPHPRQAGPEWSACGKRGLGVKPRRGDALLFYSLHPDGSLDPASTHASCPTLRGEKWSATKWMHVQAIPDPNKGECADRNPKCVGWAEANQCAENPAFMHVNCARSCHRCTGKLSANRRIVSDV